MYLCVEDDVGYDFALTSLWSTFTIASTSYFRLLCKRHDLRCELVLNHITEFPGNHHFNFSIILKNLLRTSIINIIDDRDWDCFSTFADILADNFVLF